MGKKSQPAPPKPVDPYEIAGADALYNRIDTFLPGSSLTYSGPERNQATLSLSPEMQQAFDMQGQVDRNALEEALRRQMTSQEGSLPELTRGLDESQLGRLPSADDFVNQRDMISQTLFDRSRALLDPIYADKERGLRDLLANQGLPQSSEAFQHDLGNFNREMGDTYSRLAMDSTLMGGQEQNRLFNLTLQSQAAEIQKQLQNANLSQSARSQLQNELAQVLGQQQIAQPGLQNFFTPGQADVTGGFGLNAQMQSNAFNAQSQAASNAKGGLADAAGGLLSIQDKPWIFSDARLKDNVILLTKDRGLNVYTWSWNEEAKRIGADWQPTSGYIAQEVREIYPDAVLEVNGYLTIDYSKLNEVH